MSYQVPQHIDGNKIFIVQRSELERRLDPTVYKAHFKFVSKKHKNVKLSEIAWIDPYCSFDKQKEVSFIPMDAIDSDNGTIAYMETRRVDETKGYTKFREGDILWAKITPCMQNGKSAIASNLLNGYGCGSTEYFVIRPKDNQVVLQEYLLFLLRDEKILKSAMNYFGGSAGQQRVSPTFLQSFSVPLPSIDQQKEMCLLLQSACQSKHKNDAKARKLLDSIDTYILDELKISLPEVKAELKDRMFCVSFNELTGRRMDSKRYSLNTKQLFSAINESFYPCIPLRNYVSTSCSGDWGIDCNSEDTPQGFVKCLTLRATEIDNQYNICITPEKAKCRLIKWNKYKCLDLKVDDIIIEKSGGSEDQPVGRVAIIKEESYNGTPLSFSNFLMKIRVKGINPDYLYFFLKSMYNIGMTESMQSQTNGIRNLIVKEFLEQTIVVPPLDKQKEITSHIQMIRQRAKQLQEEGKMILENAKKEVERMIIG
jgi:type I restriction enzyme S subunit